MSSSISPRRVSPGAVVFFVLLTATLAVAVLTVRARTPDLVLEVLSPGRNFTFAPGGEEEPRSARIEFFVRRSDPAAKVTIVDSEEDAVRTLDPSVALEADEVVTYVWDGFLDSGAPAPPGRYRLGVELPDSDRQMVWPIRITLEQGGAIERREASGEGEGEF